MYHLICPKSEIHTIEKRIYQNISLKNQKKGKFRNVPSDLSKIRNPYIRKRIYQNIFLKIKKQINFETHHLIYPKSEIYRNCIKLQNLLYI